MSDLRSTSFAAVWTHLPEIGVTLLSIKRSPGTKAKSGLKINEYVRVYFSTHLFVSGSATFAPQDTHDNSSVGGEVQRTTAETYCSSLLLD